MSPVPDSGASTRTASASADGGQTALVTGAAGFIGSHLVEGLLDRGYRVRGLDSLAGGHRDRLATARSHDRFAFVEGDVRNRETVGRALADVDHVYHLAADTSVPASFDRPATVTDVNCTGTATVLEAATARSVEALVLASSAAVYGSAVTPPTAETAPLDPESPYALSKRYGEQLLEMAADDHTPSTTAVRYFNVYGPRQDPDGPYAAVVPAVARRLLDGRPPVIYGDGEQTRDFVYVSDVVDATIRATACDCDTVLNVASGTRTSITDLATILADIVDSPVDPVYEPARAGDIRHSGADISRAREQLGFEPTVSLREGLERTVAGIQNRS